MSLFHSPQIIRNGLTLYLDAANVKSYPGTGSTWYDLSSKNTNANMYGSVPYTTDLTQCFDFSSASGANSPNSSLGFTLSSSVTPSIGSYTFECWVKNPPYDPVQYGMFSNAGGGDGFRWGVSRNGVYVLCGPTYTEGAIAYSSSWDNTKWHHVITIFDRSGIINGSPNIYLYLDGVYQTNTLSLPSSQTSQNATAPGIVRSPCCGIWTGKLAKLSVYNGIFTANQVTTNFEANRGRFGI